jgi:adenylate cyclase
VIAPRTALTYRGKSVDAKEVGKELGVRYVVEGSVQRDQNRVRVNAQLIDAASGAHLWADRFEEDLADLFKLQDQVVARLGNTLGFELVRAEANKSARSADPDAIDLTMRGWAALWRGIQQQSMTEKQEIYHMARTLFEQALAIDPNYADAHWLATLLSIRLTTFTAGAPGPTMMARSSVRPTALLRSRPTTCVGIIRRASICACQIARTKRSKSPTTA